MASSDPKQRLLQLTERIKTYFDLTGAAGWADRWETAFLAVRRHDGMAADFVSDLRNLVEHIDREYGAGVSPGDALPPVTSQAAANIAVAVAAAHRRNPPLKPPSAKSPITQETTAAPKTSLTPDDKLTTRSRKTPTISPSPQQPSPASRASISPPSRSQAPRFGPASEEQLCTQVTAPPKFDDEPTRRTVIPPAARSDKPRKT